MFCIHCGVQNPDNANFCSNCGKEQIDKSTEEVAEPQPKVHHPWMTAQPTQEEVSEVPQEETQQQAKGEMPEALKSILDRVKGWSTTKKVVWGVVLGFLFLVCVGVAVGEPVEEEGAVAKSGTPQATATPDKDSKEYKGEHCMGKAQRNIDRDLRERLNDPGSYKSESIHIFNLLASRIAAENNPDPWPGKAKHWAYMVFSAENAFGGRVKSEAYYWVDNETCDVIYVKMES